MEIQNGLDFYSFPLQVLSDRYGWMAVGDRYPWIVC